MWSLGSRWNALHLVTRIVPEQRSPLSYQHHVVPVQLDSTIAGQTSTGARMPSLATVVAAVCAVLAARLWTWSGRRFISPPGEGNLDHDLRTSIQAKGVSATQAQAAACERLLIRTRNHVQAVDHSCCMVCCTLWHTQHWQCALAHCDMRSLANAADRTPSRLLSFCRSCRSCRRLPMKCRAGSSAAPEVTPITLPRLTSLPEFDEGYRERMLWGTYRCGQYLGALRCSKSEGPGSLLRGALTSSPFDMPVRRSWQSSIDQRVSPEPPRSWAPCTAWREGRGQVRGCSVSQPATVRRRGNDKRPMHNGGERACLQGCACGGQRRCWPVSCGSTRTAQMRWTT